jgi:hypothetical protein
VNFSDADKLTVSRLYHSMAEGLAHGGELRSAVTCEKEAYSIARSMLGDEHAHTITLRNVLEHYTKAAVEQAVSIRQQQDQISFVEPLEAAEGERKHAGSSAAKKKNKKGKKK